MADTGFYLLLDKVLRDSVLENATGKVNITWMYSTPSVYNNFVPNSRGQVFTDCCINIVLDPILTLQIRQSCH